MVQQGSVNLGSINGEGGSFPNRLYQFGVIWLHTLGVDQQGRASSFLNRLYQFGVIGLCTFGVNWWGGPPHFSKGSTGLVQQGSVNLGSINGEGGSFPNRLYQFGVIQLRTLGVDQQGRASSFLNRLYQFGLIGLCTFGDNWWGRAFSFLNRFYWNGVVGLCKPGLNQWGGWLFSQQVILVWCNTALYTWG